MLLLSGGLVNDRFHYSIIGRDVRRGHETPYAGKVGSNTPTTFGSPPIVTRSRTKVKHCRLASGGLFHVEQDVDSFERFSVPLGATAPFGWIGTASTAAGSTWNSQRVRRLNARGVAAPANLLGCRRSQIHLERTDLSSIVRGSLVVHSRSTGHRFAEKVWPCVWLRRVCRNSDRRPHRTNLGTEPVFRIPRLRRPAPLPDY